MCKDSTIRWNSTAEGMRTEQCGPISILFCGAGRRARTVVLGKKKKNARAHAGRQAKLRLDGSKLGQKRRGSDLGAM